MLHAHGVLELAAAAAAAGREANCKFKAAAASAQVQLHDPTDGKGWREFRQLPGRTVSSVLAYGGVQLHVRVYTAVGAALLPNGVWTSVGEGVFVCRVVPWVICVRGVRGS